MSQVLFCGDIHNKAKRILPRVDEVITQQGINHVVFLGDYVDEFNEGAKRIIDSTLFLADWVKTRRSEGLTVNALLGNHDLPYVVVYQDPGYYQVRNSVAVPSHSSAQYKLRDTMRSMIDAVAVYISYKDTATGVQRGLVASHAGFVESWSNKFGYKDVKDLVNKTNRLYKQDSLYRLSWAGPERGGFDLPSPCWAGEHKLIEGAVHGVTQVVGHTPTWVLSSAFLMAVVTCGFAIRTAGFSRSSAEMVRCSCLILKKVSSRLSSRKAGIDSSGLPQPFISLWRTTATPVLSFVTIARNIY